MTFSLPRGTTLGICGVNGSGKTTLMRLISGIYSPDEGSATVAGRTSALLSLGVGISASLSGRENLDVVGAVHGLKRRDVRERYEEIRDFAGLDDFRLYPTVSGRFRFDQLEAWLEIGVGSNKPTRTLREHRQSR